jgi:predicted RNase H-like HicB family nuclease
VSNLVFPIVIERDVDGCFAECPGLQGCHAQGSTYEEVLANIQDAVELHVQDRKARGERIDPPAMLSVTTLQVSA